jgi:hypothetical protein
VTDAAQANLRGALAAARERLAALAERVARTRARLAQGTTPAAASSSSTSAPAPFGGADARPIEDLELTFRAVDAGEGVSDQDKAR